MAGEEKIKIKNTIANEFFELFFLVSTVKFLEVYEKRSQKKFT